VRFVGFGGGNAGVTVTPNWSEIFTPLHDRARASKYLSTKDYMKWFERS
jgi:hypothetical protein